jgi:uncharacterized protein (DUF2141 family)
MWGACAEPRALLGGEQDKTPPRLDASKYSTPNKILNFVYPEIILTFDEWVILDQPQTKILVSPALTQKPVVKVRNKSVIFTFKETLRPNTTYTVNFGESVKDLTEGNPAKNLKYVFSTGDYLDSLRLKGQIVDAETGLGVPDILVMLYDSLADAVPYKEKPFYFVRTDTKGEFQFEQLKTDSFRIFALADKNGNYLYDANEPIGFWDNPFFLSAGYTPQTKIRLFTEKQPIQISNQKPAQGNTWKVFFNQPITKTPVIEALENAKNINIIQIWDADSLSIFLPNTLQKGLTYEWMLGTDTIKVRTDNFSPKDTFVIFKCTNLNQDLGKFDPAIGFSLDFNRPIGDWDTSKIRLFVDTFKQPQAVQIRKDSLNPRKIWFASNWESKKYRLEILPNALTDYLGKPQKDTIRVQAQPSIAADYGTLQLQIEGLDSTSVPTQHIVQLMQNKQVVQTFRFLSQPSSSKFVHTFEKLLPAIYSVRLIVDKNQNGLWDVGKCLQKIQPEPIMNSTPIGVRAGWDSELKMSILP